MAAEPERWTRCHLSDQNQETLYCMAPREPLTSELAFDKAMLQELTCPLCLEIFKEPETSSTCGHVFCRGCLALVLTSGRRTCPLCQKELGKHHPALTIRNVASMVELRCRHGMSFNPQEDAFEPAGEGGHLPGSFCEEKLRAANRRAHEESCPHGILPCRWRNEGCTVVMPRQKVQEHSDECHGDALVACSNEDEGCTARISWKDEQTHLQTACLVEKARPLLLAKDEKIRKLKEQVERLNQTVSRMGRQMRVGGVAASSSAPATAAADGSAPTVESTFPRNVEVALHPGHAGQHVLLEGFFDELCIGVIPGRQLGVPDKHYLAMVEMDVAEDDDSPIRRRISMFSIRPSTWVRCADGSIRCTDEAEREYCMHWRTHEAKVGDWVEVWYRPGELDPDFNGCWYLGQIESIGPPGQTPRNMIVEWPAFSSYPSSNEDAHQVRPSSYHAYHQMP